MYSTTPLQAKNSLRVPVCRSTAFPCQLPISLAEIHPHFEQKTNVPVVI